MTITLNRTFTPTTEQRKEKRFKDQQKSFSHLNEQRQTYEDQSKLLVTVKFPSLDIFPRKISTAQNVWFHSKIALTVKDWSEIRQLVEEKARHCLEEMKKEVKEQRTVKSPNP